MFPWFSYREFILSSEASAEVDRMAASDARVHDEMMGVEWTLVRKPEVGSQIAPDVYLFINHRPTATAHLITVMYTYDDDKIEVMRLWIRQ